MTMFMNSYPKNPKMDEWMSKNEDEQSDIAEQNGWSWYWLWGDIANELRYEYERADKSPNVRSKYGGYDGWGKPKKQGEEYAPCTNKECPYYDPIGWGEDRYKGANCSYWGNTDRMFECSDELFVLIRKWIDVCGIEALDQLKEEWNIHSDIIGWFKDGDDYFKQNKKMIEAKIILYENNTKNEWGKKLFPKYDDDFVTEIIKYFNSWDIYESKDLKIDENEDECKLIFHMDVNQVEEDDVVTEYKEDLEISFDNRENYCNFLKVAKQLTDKVWYFNGYAWIDSVTIEKANIIKITDESVEVYYNDKIVANAFIRYVNEVGYKDKHTDESHIVYEHN